MVIRLLNKIFQQKLELIDILFDTLDDCIKNKDIDGIERLVQTLKIETDSMYYHLEEAISYPVKKEGNDYGNK